MTKHTGQTFTPEELGMEHVVLDSKEKLKKFPSEVEAKCGECGASFRYERGDGLSCPVCAAYFERVWFTQSRKIAFFEGDKVG